MSAQSELDSLLSYVKLKAPQLRHGQIICNAAAFVQIDPYYMTDDELVDGLHQMAEIIDRIWGGTL
jgi:hypothetical protein